MYKHVHTWPQQSQEANIYACMDIRPGLGMAICINLAYFELFHAPILMEQSINAWAKQQGMDESHMIKSDIYI